MTIAGGFQLILMLWLVHFDVTLITHDGVYATKVKFRATKQRAYSSVLPSAAALRSAHLGNFWPGTTLKRASPAKIFSMRPLIPDSVTASSESIENW